MVEDNDDDDDVEMLVYFYQVRSFQVLTLTPGLGVHLRKLGMRLPIAQKN